MFQRVCLGYNSYHFMIAFDLPYTKLLHNNYIIFIRLFCWGMVQSLSHYGSVSLIRYEII